MRTGAVVHTVGTGRQSDIRRFEFVCWTANGRGELGRDTTSAMGGKIKDLQRVAMSSVPMSHSRYRHSLARSSAGGETVRKENISPMLRCDVRRSVGVVFTGVAEGTMSVPSRLAEHNPLRRSATSQYIALNIYLRLHLFSVME